jgi:hypothetical protein
MVVRTSGATLNVVAAQGATLYSGASGLVSDLAAFRVGDRVGVQGTRTANRVVATKVGSIFRPIQARVDRVSSDGASADTTEGRVLLTAGQLPVQRPVGATRRAEGLHPGLVLQGLGWTDPSNGDRYLLVRG